MIPDTDPLLKEFRLSVFHRRPLKERLRILHRLAEKEGPGNEWDNDIVQYEKERCLEIEQEFSSLLKDKDNDDRVLEFVNELKELYYASPIVEKMRQQAEAYLSESRLAKEAVELEDIRRSIDVEEDSAAEMTERLRSAAERLNGTWEHPDASKLRQWIVNKLNAIRLDEEKSWFENFRQEAEEIIDSEPEELEQTKILLERVRTELVERKWIHHPGSDLRNDAEDLLKRIGVKIQHLNELIERKKIRHEFLDILNEMKRHEPNDAFIYIPSPYFKRACNRWKKKANNLIPPADLADQAAKIIEKSHSRFATFRRRLLGSGIVAVFLLCILAIYTVRHSAKSSSLVSAFIQAVDSKQVSHAEELYELLSKDYPAQTKTPAVLKAKNILEQQVNDTKGLREKIKALEVRCNKSIKIAENSADGIDADLLDEEALLQLRHLTLPMEAQATVSVLEDKFESIRIRTKARLDEIERKNLYKENYDVAMASTVSRKATDLNRRALNRAEKEAKLPEEISSLNQLHQKFLQIKEESKEKARVENYKQLYQLVTNSIEEAKKDPDQFEPDNLNDNALESAKEIATASEMAEVIRLEQIFAEIRQTALEQTRDRKLLDFNRDLAKITASIGDRNAYSAALKTFLEKHPESREEEMSIAMANMKNDYYWLPMQKWNELIEKHSDNVDFMNVSIEQAKEFSSFIATNERTLSFVPEFALLKNHKEVYANIASGVSPAEKIKLQFNAITETKLWLAKANAERFCYFDKKPVVGRNVCYIDRTLGDTTPPAIIISEENMAKVSIAPQQTLIDTINERLKTNTTEQRVNDPKEYYSSWMDIIDIILNDEDTDPFLRCMILDDVISALVQADLFFSLHARNWNNELVTNGFDRKTNWTNPLSSSLKKQRQIAIELMKSFPRDELETQIQEFCELNEENEIRKASVKVNYRWIAWVGVDSSGKQIIRQNPEQTKTIVSDFTGPDFANDPLDLYILLRSTYRSENRSTSLASYSLKKIGTWNKGEIKTNDNEQIPAGFPVFIRLPMGSGKLKPNENNLTLNNNAS